MIGSGGEYSPLNQISIRIIFCLRPTKADAAEVRDIRERTMKKSLAMISAAALVAMVQSGHAQDASRDITRFAPLKADELAPAQKAWADAIAVPPRNAKWGAPPYRAYIRNPELAPKLSALSDYLRWNSTLPPRLSELAILITARNWTAQYEWHAHYTLALKAGLDVK